MKVQGNEFYSKNNNKTYENIWKCYKEKYNDIIFCSESIPKLCEVRGKIFIFSYNPFILGTYDEIRCITNSYLSSISFQWIELKNAFIDFYNNAIKGNRKQYFYINTLCVKFNGWNFAYQAASSCNSFIYEIKENSGIIRLDFPGEGVIDHIIKLNFF